MTRTACHAFDPEVLSARTNGDAVVSSSDGGVEDGNISRQLDVDAVRVGAVTIGDQLHSSHLHILAMIYYHVEHLAIQ